MKLISIVTHRGEREAVLAVLEDGSSFRAPVFDDRGELITCYEGDMEKLGELVSGFVTGGVSRRRKGSGPEEHPPAELTPGKPKGPAGHPGPRPSLRAGSPSGVPDAILLVLSELARACVATLKTGVLADDRRAGCVT